MTALTVKYALFSEKKNMLRIGSLLTEVVLRNKKQLCALTNGIKFQLTLFSFLFYIL